MSLQRHKIAIISDIDPRNINNGASARIIGLLEFFKSLGVSITYVLISPSGKSLTRTKSLLGHRIVFILGKPEGTSSEQRILRKRLRRYFNNNHMQTVIAEFVHVGQHLQPAPDTTWVIDTHNAYFVRRKLFRRFDYEFRHNISLLKEISVLKKFNLVLAISRSERVAFKTILPVAEILTVGYTRQVRPTRNPSKSSKPYLLVVGYKNDPNVDGLFRFVRDVWTLVRKIHPALELHVYGALAGKVHGDILQPGVVPVGHRRDLSSAYRGCLAVINPVLVGTGIEIKSVDALLYGKTLITYPNGARGLELAVKRRAMLVANSPLRFARYLNRVVRYPKIRKTIEKKARRFTATVLRSEIVYRPLALRLGINERVI